MYIKVSCPVVNASYAKNVNESTGASQSVLPVV